MTREVGTTFGYKGKTLRVERDAYPYCTGCFFEEDEERCWNRDCSITGRCAESFYSGNWVKFVEVKEGGEK